MKKLGLTFAVIGVLIAGFTQTSKAADVLRIATEGAYPPFNMVDSEGNPAGFDVDLAWAICEKIGRECEIVVQDWDGIIPGLLARKYDVVVASMTITDERRKKIDFTDKYYQTPDRFVARKGANLDFSADGLAGKHIGVQRATTHQCYVDKFHSNANISLYPVQEDTYSDLIAGRIDTLFANAASIQEALLDSENGSDFELVGEVISDPECLGEGAGISLRQGNEELRDAISQAVLDLRADGTYKTINDKYFKFDVYGAELP